MRIVRRSATGVGLSVGDEAQQIISSYGCLSGDFVEKRLQDKRVHRTAESDSDIMRLIVPREFVGGYS